MAARNTFEGDVKYSGQNAIDLFNAIKDFYSYNNNSNGEVPAPKVNVIDATGATGGGGGGSSLSPWMLANVGNVNFPQFNF